MKEGFKGSRAVVLPAVVVAEMESDPFASQLYITDIGYYPLASMHIRLREEGISQYILIYCIDGEGWYELDGVRHTISANQLFVLPAGVPHSYGASQSRPWTIYWLHFKGSLAQYFADGLCSPQDILPDKNSRIAERISLFEDILQLLEDGYIKDNILMATSALYNFLGSVKYLKSYRHVNRGSGDSDTLVGKAVAYMRENIEKRVNIRDLCRYIGCSESHFTSQFKKQIGLSPITYLLQLKMQKACHLLDFTDMKINQICYKVGISDPYYFSKTFARIVGMSPSEYRKQIKG